MAHQRRQEPRYREVQEGWVAKVPPPPELPRPEAVLVAKPRLGDEVEALFAEAAALVASRPRRNTRLQILEEEMQRHGAAKKIGNAWRQQAQNRQQKAAQLLQNHFRGWCARRVVQRERERQRASRLQRWWRKKRFYLAWLQMHEQRKAAVKLQAYHRGNKARQEVYNMLVLQSRAVLRMQAVFRGQRARRKVYNMLVLRAVLRMQAVFRGQRARRKVYNMLVFRSRAVLRMQAVFRGQRARRKAKKQQQCVRKIQAHWRWHRLWQAYLRERQRRRTAAATKLQALIRGFIARCRFLRMAGKEELQGGDFAVQGETTQNTELDGQVLGTTAPPGMPARTSPEGIEATDVPNSRSSGYNGQMRVDQADDAIRISANSKDLQKGDVVGPVVSAAGEGRIHQNNDLKLSKEKEQASAEPEVSAQLRVPVDSEHRGAEGAAGPSEPPALGARGNVPVPAQTLTETDDLITMDASVRPSHEATHLLPTAQPPDEGSDVGSEVDMEETRCDDGPVMEPAVTYDFSSSQLTAFALQPRPKDVILSAEMLLVKRKSNIFSQDLVYGNGVAPSGPLGSYFEVRLESAVSRGFALGFQAANAVGTKLTEAPATACSLGFDGMALIGGNSTLVSDWPTRPWLSSDRLGLLASAGYLALAVNDQWMVEVPGAIPEGPLVPFVDLGGGPMAISLEVGAKAPKGSALSGFNRRLCSPLVTLDGKTKAIRTGVHPKGAGLGCVLFGDGPVPSFPEGRYFEVCIEEVTKVFADGLNLGVAVGLPSALPAEAYATCEEVPRSFCYGFDGMAHRHDMEDMIPIDWSPENLEIGDAVGILVPAQGVMQLIVNGMLEAQVIDGLPEEELFPLVELMGNTVAVSIRPGVAPPAIREKVKEAPEEPAPPEVAEAPPAPAPALMPMPTETLPHAAAAELATAQRPSVANSQQRPSALPALPLPRRSTEQRVPVKATEPAFCAQLLSRHMQLSKDGNSVRHKDETGRELYGIAMGNSPLIPFPAGRYFEVRVDRVRENMPDGLAVGFTLVPPNELAGEDPHEVSDTLPESWTAGYDGFYRSVNFEETEQVRVGWKPSSLEVNDRVGALLSRAGQFIVVVNGKVVARVADDFPLADVEAFYPVVDLLGRVCQVTMVRDAVPPAAAVDGTIFTGFDPKLLGKAVSLSNARLFCSSSDPVGKELGGVVFGDAPLPCTGPDGEAYFEVVVEELRQGNDDGLVLGVASKRPQSMDDILMGCDVKEAWSIGYNGCSFSPDEEEDVPVKWSPVDLKRGDHVGLLIQGDGSMIVLLNAAPVCKGPKKAPVLDVPLHPFVDLLGNTKAVQLIRPTPELVKTAVVNCAKAVKRSLVSGGKDPAFFDAW